LLLRQRQTRYFEILGTDEHEPISDVRVYVRHLIPDVAADTAAACIAVSVPDSLGRAIRWFTSPSWELNHVDPGERTARKLLESAAHLDVSEVDGHEPEPFDELRDLLLRRRVVARDK
jgi:hypothetical protein